MMILTEQGSHVAWFEGIFKLKRVKYLQFIFKWFVNKSVDYIEALNSI